LPDRWPQPMSSAAAPAPAPWMRERRLGRWTHNPDGDRDHLARVMENLSPEHRGRMPIF
jgi:hypothetical protein